MEVEAVTGLAQALTGTGGALVGAVCAIWYLKTEREKVNILLIDALNQRIKAMEAELVSCKESYNTLLAHVLKLKPGV